MVKRTDAPIKILYADDDVDDREIFVTALKDAGKAHQFVTAINGKDALEKLDAEKIFIPDFIFLDLNMPIMSGKQFLQEIKKLPRLSHIPVVIYTTSSYDKDLQETKMLGATHFITKPSNIDILTKILSTLFNKQNLPFFLNRAI